MNSIAATIQAAVRTNARLVGITAAIAATGWLGDFFFWRHEPGISVGLFASVIALGIWALGQRTKTGLIVLGALLLTALQSAIELSFTNGISLLALLVLLGAETQLGGLANGWPRWSEALFFWAIAPLRWLGFVGAWAEVRAAVSKEDGPGGPTLGRLLLATLPAVFVAFGFAVLLEAGNAVLAVFFARLQNAAWLWIADLSVARTFLWLIWLTFGLAAFWPPVAPNRARWWTRVLPRWRRGEKTLAIWQSACLLLAVNFVFGAANSADVIYLWANARLPETISASQFVHEGVHALITATVLAGVMLAAIFHQDPEVSESRMLKWLGLAWVAQNFLLILGVFRRLALYIETYEWTELRVYLGCFLLIVSVGYVLLAAHIWRGLDLGRLFQANAASVLLLFFVLQFCDVPSWVARRNVRQWLLHQTDYLEFPYLVSLGANGWPWLVELAQSSRDAGMTEQARQAVREVYARELSFRADRDWRSFQWRRDGRFEEVLRPAAIDLNP